MVVNLGLVYKVLHHSGVIFQFVAFIKKRKRTVPDIVAAGGRYDHLVGFVASFVKKIYHSTYVGMWSISLLVAVSVCISLRPNDVILHVVSFI